MKPGDLLILRWFNDGWIWENILLLSTQEGAWFKIYVKMDDAHFMSETRVAYIEHWQKDAYELCVLADE